jgi:hypothetical protein
MVLLSTFLGPAAEFGNATTVSSTEAGHISRWLAIFFSVALGDGDEGRTSAKLVSFHQKDVWVRLTFIHRKFLLGFPFQLFPVSAFSF